MPGRLGRGRRSRPGRWRTGHPRRLPGQRRGASLARAARSRAWTRRAARSSGSTCRSACWKRAGARPTGPPAVCSAPAAAPCLPIPPRAVWAEESYPAANLRCRELTGQGFSVQAWGLRAKLLEASEYREGCGHPMYEVHPELAFGALAGAPLAASKHTAAGRDARRRVLAEAGIEIAGPAPRPSWATSWMRPPWRGAPAASRPGRPSPSRPSRSSTTGAGRSRSGTDGPERHAGLARPRAGHQGRGMS